MLTDYEKCILNIFKFKESILIKFKNKNFSEFMYYLNSLSISPEVGDMLLNSNKFLLIKKSTDVEYYTLKSFGLKELLIIFQKR